MIHMRIRKLRSGDDKTCNNADFAGLFGKCARSRWETDLARQNNENIAFLLTYNLEIIFDLFSVK